MTKTFKTFHEIFRSGLFENRREIIGCIRSPVVRRAETGQGLPFGRHAPFLQASRRARIQSQCRVVNFQMNLLIVNSRLNLAAACVLRQYSNEEDFKKISVKLLVVGSVKLSQVKIVCQRFSGWAFPRI
jgi:hypothetical protein